VILAPVLTTETRIAIAATAENQNHEATPFERGFLVFGSFDRAQNLLP